MTHTGLKFDRSSPDVTRLTWSTHDLPERKEVRSCIAVQVLPNRPPVDMHWNGDGVIEIVSPSTQVAPEIKPFSADPRCACKAANLPSRPMGPSSGLDGRVHYTRQYTPSASPPFSLEDVICVLEFANETA